MTDQSAVAEVDRGLSKNASVNVVGQKTGAMLNNPS